MLDRSALIAGVGALVLLGGGVAGAATAPPARASTGAAPCASSGDCRHRLELADGQQLPYYGSHPLSGSSAVTRAVVVVHGTDRNADDYFDAMVQAAEDAGAASDTEIVAPSFQTSADDPAGDEPVWTNGGDTSWKDGGDAVSPDHESSFAVMDEIVTRLADPSRFPNLKRITVTGHSAGGQFTQRYAVGAKASGGHVPVRYVTANPSSYLYFGTYRPDDEGLPGSCPGFNAYKYGMDDRNAYLSGPAGDLVRRYTGRDVTYLLGGADTTNSHDMDDSCEAMAQGPNRLARGESYYAHLHRTYPDAPHRQVIVPGVGHDHTAMYDSPEGRAAVFGDPAPTTTAARTDTVARTSAASCTVHVEDTDHLDAVQPGDVVCIDGDLSDTRLDLTRGGTADAPVTYLGPDGQQVGGIDVDGDHIVVDGYTMDRPSAPGVEMEGDGDTLQNLTISGPHGGDGDGIRFFGTHLKILDNKIHGTRNSNGHADCMQTFADDTPPSHDVLIQGNRCEDVDNMGLMAEGPNDGEGDGEGHTYDVTVRDNYYETNDANQELMIEDIQHLTVSGNTFAGDVDHAIGLAIGSTDAHVTDDNTYSPDIGCKVGIDDSSRSGYTGPEPECEA